VPDRDTWRPDHPAIWQERVRRTGDDEPHTTTVRHPTYPFTAPVADPTGEELIQVAAQYLRKIAVPLFGFPTDLLTGRDFDPTKIKSIIPLTWLALDDGRGPAERADASFWINHYGQVPPEPDTRPIDRTAILLAVPALTPNQQDRVLGSRMAIRIVAHVAGADAGTTQIMRITGATCSSELVAIDVESLDDLMRVVERNDLFSDNGSVAFARKVAAKTGLNPWALWIDGVRIRTRPGRDPLVEVYLNYEPEVEPVPAPAYAVTARLPADGDPDQMTVKVRPLVSHCAAVTEPLFYKNPPSRSRPNRKPAAFADDMRPTELPGLAPMVSKGGGSIVKLEDKDFGEIAVMESRLVTKDSKENTVQNAKRPKHARTNEFAAFSAYQHARELLHTMRRYGLAPQEYFKHARLPLVVRYRAGIHPGPGKDGKVVNAMVDYDPPRRNHRNTAKSGGKDPLPLQIRFALADIKRSASRHEPLGVACDPRWSWHEYGHVLLAASTGALELAFAHSTGDALAAIVGDPSLELDDPRRMTTFPWVYLNRSHGRPVASGWGWCGSYHRQDRFQSKSPFRRKGYDSEQILSTSLFRLYRALGGDTASDPDMRQAAADYTTYLIMRAIAWLGPVTHVPTETPDQLVSALIDADVGTVRMPQPAMTLPELPLLARRVGGCAHKVVRWAFEAQGLYATTEWPEIVDAPGRPPEVDVFIDDRRPDSDGAHPRGGYMPVPLDWRAADAPPWHATDDAVQVDGNSDVRVTVRNRGSNPANDVVVDVWYAEQPNAGDEAPDWDAAGTTLWTHLGTTPPQTVPAGDDGVTFGPVAGLPTDRRVLVLAAASCPGDPANTDPATELPCAAGPTPIIDLVAGDNNLGLRVCG
jgi:hypothetical protein